MAHSLPVWLAQTETWIFGQVDQLQQLGMNTHVVCQRTENLKQFSVENVHCLQTSGDFRTLFEKVSRRMRKRLPLTNRVESNRQTDYLVSVGRKTSCNIVHSHFGVAGWKNLAAVRRLRAKHVVTFYGYDASRLPVEKPEWLDRYLELFSEVDLVLCEGSHMARRIMDLGCPSNIVKVHHLGVDVENIKFRPRKWHSGETLRVLIAASFRQKKGIPFAIKALELVSRTVNVELTIIGDASDDPKDQDEKTEIISELKKSNLVNHTRFLGYQKHSALFEHAYRHHVFIQPSITAQNGDTEGGAPVTLIELLASGMPIVSTSHCDIPEVVGQAFSRFLAPEKNAPALADLIISLTEEADNWPQMLRSSRTHIEDEYNVHRQAKYMVKHYQSLL